MFNVGRRCVRYIYIYVLTISHNRFSYHYQGLFIHEFIIECELSLVENIFYSILIKFDHRWRRVSVAENLFSQSNNKWFLSIPNDEIEFDVWVCELYTNFNIWIWVNKLINQFRILIGAIELQSYISQTFWSISFYEKIN